MKQLLSVVTIVGFVIIAAASFGPDASTNTTVAISDCETKPDVAGTLQVVIDVLAENGVRIPNATGRIFIVHQKVHPDETCTFAVTQQVINFTTNQAGMFVYDGIDWLHDNSEDLFRVEIEGDGGLEPFPYVPWRRVYVHKYSDAKFLFRHRVIGSL